MTGLRARAGAIRARQSTGHDTLQQKLDVLRPSIERCASYAFRRLPHHRRQENIADVVAHAFVAFTRLVERKLEALIYPTVLAQFAIRRVQSGRELGVRQNVNDVLSPLAQTKKGFLVERLFVARSDGQ